MLLVLVRVLLSKWEKSAVQNVFKGCEWKYENIMNKTKYKTNIIS